MKRILVFLRRHTSVLAIAILAVGVTAANAQAPAGPHRPAAVPEGYLVTPNGYFHPSCIHQLAKDDTVLKDEGAIRHADGTLENIPACTYPRYRSDGTPLDEDAGKIAEDNGTIAKEAGKTEPAPCPVTMICHAWVEGANVSTEWSYGELTATWVVPPAPASDNGQTIYFFPGLEDSNDSKSTILQPVLGWQSGQWSISNVNCCVNGNQLQSTPVGVNSGDTIAGAIMDNCNPGTLSCGTWTIIIEDVTQGIRSPTFNTSSYGETFNWAFSGVLEVYNIYQCSDYPERGALTFTNVALYGDHFQLLPDPAWTHGTPGAGLTPQCNYNVLTSADSITFEYGAHQIEAAFQANTTDLWFVSSPAPGPGDLKLGMMRGTSPSIGLSPDKTVEEEAFQANTGSLWLWKSGVGAVDLKLGMMAGTSPSIAVAPNGTTEIAFQANTGSLWLWGGPGGDKKLGMMAGTSPSIAVMPDGTTEVAFQANTSDLWLWSSSGGPAGDINLGMKAGTSPSIAVMPSGTVDVAFQANTGSLYLWASEGNSSSNLRLGMMEGTSPSLAAFPDSTVAVGFQANTGSLWLWTSGVGTTDLNLGMMAGSSPSIAALALIP